MFEFAQSRNFPHLAAKYPIDAVTGTLWRGCFATGVTTSPAGFTKLSSDNYENIYPEKCVRMAAAKGFKYAGIT